jgi:hypothetical protein
MLFTKTTSLDGAVSLFPRSRSAFFSTATPVGVIAIADTFGGLVQDIFPATLILRTAMVGFLIIYILGSATYQQNLRILWLVFVGYLLIRIIVDCIVFQNLQVLFLELGAALKLIYFPLLYNYLYMQILKGKICANDIRGLLSIYGWLILVSLMLGNMTGLGGTIGGRGIGMEGGKGFMIGANEVGLMLLLSAPFVGMDIMRLLRSNVLGGMVQFIVYAAAGWHVFTKSSLLVVFTNTFFVYRKFVKLGRYTKWSIRIILLGFGMYVAVQTMRSLDEIEAFALDTFFAALISDDFVSFLFRGRQDYISAIYPQLIKHDLNGVFLVFGAGEFFIRELSIGPLMLNQGQGTTFEMDLFDLVGAYGIIGALLFGTVVITMVPKADLNCIPLDIKIAIFCVLLHAIMAGHVLFSPQVTTLIALILLYFRDDGRKLLRTRYLQQ